MFFFQPLTSYKQSRRCRTFRVLEAYRILQKPFLSKIQHGDIVFSQFFRIRQIYNLLMFIGVIDPLSSNMTLKKAYEHVENDDHTLKSDFTTT